MVCMLKGIVWQEYDEARVVAQKLLVDSREHFLLLISHPPTMHIAQIGGLGWWKKIQANWGVPWKHTHEELRNEAPLDMSSPPLTAHPFRGRIASVLWGSWPDPSRGLGGPHLEALNGCVLMVPSCLGCIFQPTLSNNAQLCNTLERGGGSFGSSQWARSDCAPLFGLHFPTIPLEHNAQ